MNFSCCLHAIITFFLPESAATWSRLEATRALFLLSFNLNFHSFLDCSKIGVNDLRSLNILGVYGLWVGLRSRGNSPSRSSYVINMLYCEYAFQITPSDAIPE